MSLSILIALSMAGTPAATDSVILPSDRPAVAQSARRQNVPVRMLYRAMTAPVQPRRTDEVRYCMPRAAVVAGKKGMVCRTRDQWADFGLLVRSRRG